MLFGYPPEVREKKFLFSDAWAIAEAYVGFCVGFTYTPSPLRRTLLYIIMKILYSIFAVFCCPKNVPRQLYLTNNQLGWSTPCRKSYPPKVVQPKDCPDCTVTCLSEAKNVMFIQITCPADSPRSGASGIFQTENFKR